MNKGNYIASGMHRVASIDWVSIGIACCYVIVMGYNRIQMGGHFLSDVCLGVLVTTCILGLFSAAFFRTTASGQSQE